MKYILNVITTNRNEEQRVSSISCGSRFDAYRAMAQGKKVMMKLRPKKVIMQLLPTKLSAFISTVGGCI